MHRRHFFLSLAAPVLAGRAQRAVEPVVIVGAGLAGLRAAAILRNAGRKVVVLEARPSPGGRVRTIRAPFDGGLHAEAGPIRIPGAHQRVLQLAREHRLGLLPFGSGVGSPLVHVTGVRAKSPQELSKVSAALKLPANEAGLGAGALIQKYAADALSTLAGTVETNEIPAGWHAYDGMTWPEWLRSRGASAGAVTLMTLGGDSRQLSALYVLRQIALLRGSDQFFKIEGGMDRLPRAMAASLSGDVRYNARLVRIDRSTSGRSTSGRSTSGPSTSGLAVQYRDQNRTVSIHAARVILTIPFSTMSSVVIQPPLAVRKARAIAELPYFGSTRFLLQTRTRFWEDEGLSGAARTDDPAEFWDAAYDLPQDAGILAATIGGTLSEGLHGLPQSEAVGAGVTLAARTFPGIRGTFQHGIVMRWALEPTARGAFAVFHPGQTIALMPDLATPEGSIHFAGEHTSPWNGWMEGALESGERAAREVLQS